MISAACARPLSTPSDNGAFHIRVLSAFTSTNQNGSLNMILRIDPIDIPCWLEKELQTWTTLDIAPPEYIAKVVIGHNTVVDNMGKKFHEPMVYQGLIRFDTRPCTPGVECPRTVYMIIPYTSDIYVQGVSEIIIHFIQRTLTPPCF